MRQALAAAALTLAVSAGLLLWIAAGLAPRQTSPPEEASRAAEADYLRAAHDPLHFRPAIETARDAQCLACHREVLEDRVRAATPSGLKTETLRAWYQQASTYEGDQETFHRRHLVTPLAKRLMRLRCNTCHQGHDPREEAPGSSADSPSLPDNGFVLRKQVDPEASCLKCHGRFSWQLMGLPGPWPQHGPALGNDCLSCHVSIRTRRHEVNYLDAAAIESAGRQDAEVCYGCHGGRAWYRISYPYARTPWPGMPEETPEWARLRPTRSEARFLAGDRP